MLKLYLCRKSPQEKYNPPATSLVCADADDSLKVISWGGKPTNSEFLREDEFRLSYLPEASRSVSGYLCGSLLCSSRGEEMCSLYLFIYIFFGGGRGEAE